MIGWAILVTKVNRNAKKAPKSPKNEMLIFGLYSNFWWSTKQSKWWKLPEMQKIGCQIIKNEMLIFGLHSTDDDYY